MRKCVYIVSKYIYIDLKYNYKVVKNDYWRSRTMTENLVIRKLSIHPTTDRYQSIIPREFINALVEEIKAKNEPLIQKINNAKTDEEKREIEKELSKIYTGWMKLDNDLLIALFYEEKTPNIQEINKNPYKYVEYKNNLAQEIYKKLATHFELNPILLKEKVAIKPKEKETVIPDTKCIELLRAKKDAIAKALKSLTPLLQETSDPQTFLKILNIFENLKFSKEESMYIDNLESA